MTFKMRPKISGPTGMAIGAPVFTTLMPRDKPSEESMAMVRTVDSPRCSATSNTRLSGLSDSCGFVTVSAV